MAIPATRAEPADPEAPRPTEPPPTRIVIQYPAPSVDGGRYAAKRCVGDHVRVEADVFRDGHDLLRAVVRYRAPEATRWQESELERVDAHLDGVRWAGGFDVASTGRFQYTVEAWTDVFGTWRAELARKLEAGQHDQSDDSNAAQLGEAGGRARRTFDGEISEGILLLRAAAERAESDADRKLIEHALATLEDATVPEAAKLDGALGPELLDTVERNQDRHGSVTLEQPLAIEVDRTLARFGAWYELFPRSWGGLKGVEKRLPELAELGFDVVYLPPIHPIGLTNRKGRDNALTAGRTDPGSPWAIGDETGGHDAVDRDLGTIEDVRSLTASARQHGIDICLDFAIQASADHPWLKQHPEWFHRRPDGTLKYAENPPKRYQDIYNVNWESPDWRGLWDALLEVVLQWVDCGVKVFRVDNPHTKPFAFWAWLIEQVHAHDRDVVFLAEAFTRRAVMRHLAKIGFSQSYTYFTWKTSRHELAEYISELAHSGEQQYFRPNFFVNTPDILHAYLQHGGRPGFEARLVLAATLSPSYGIYSGFENVENVAVKEGSEEYLHSEKYELKARSLNGELLPLIKLINFIRRDNPALQQLSNITFLETGNEALIAYAKQSAGNTVVTVVSLDPHQAQAGAANVPASLGLAPSFTAHDLLSDERFQWRIGPNYVRLEPGIRQAHVIRVEN
jgi:starch synthase (maltosyl-transferring)